MVCQISPGPSFTHHQVWDLCINTYLLQRKTYKILLYKYILKYSALKEIAIIHLNIYLLLILILLRLFLHIIW